MTDILHLSLAALTGLVLGSIFFGGLWWTVRRGLTSSRPALWFLGSYLVRGAVTMGGFYFVMQGRWERLLAAFAGFAVAKIVVLRITKPRAETLAPNGKEVGHAS
jgi:F1F0 ATPase subunit 2